MLVLEFFIFKFSGMIRIGLDMMGGDFAPLEAIKGSIEFFNEYKRWHSPGNDW